jgi:hypothetical protein
MMSIEVSQRRAVFSQLKPYCVLSGPDDYMEVTEWSNGEGYDVVISHQNSTESFGITHGGWELLQVLINWKGE